MSPEPLPDWVVPREKQLDAVDEAVELFESGVGVVYLEGPTGSGKTITGEMIRRRLDTKAIYTCSDKSLQDQFAGDFTYAKVLKGRANYETANDRRKTCDECMGKRCFFCPSRGECPYQIAKNEALNSDLAVVNTAYLLAEANTVGEFGRQELVIIDEADLLEDSLVGYVEYSTPHWLLRRANMDVPNKRSRKTTIARWLDDFAETLKRSVDEDLKADNKKHQALIRGAQGAARVAKELREEIEADPEADDEDVGHWLREYKNVRSGREWVDDGLLHMKPVLVAPYGGAKLWRHSKRFLLMSATIISPDELHDTLGNPYEFGSVVMPMEFPVANRPIIMAPIADVTYKGMNQGTAIEDLAYALQAISKRHPGERILVHTVSYKLAERLARAIDTFDMNHRVFIYMDGRNKGSVLASYLSRPDSMLLAASMSRGIDLAGDKCRVQVICKVPWPSTQDRRTSARLHLPGGQTWFTIKTVRELVQMTGRGVRGMDDQCTTYILDRQFASNLWKNRMFFPRWWRDAVDSGARIRDLMRAA